MELLHRISRALQRSLINRDLAIDGFIKARNCTARIVESFQRKAIECERHERPFRLEQVLCGADCS